MHFGKARGQERKLSIIFKTMRTCIALLLLLASSLCFAQEVFKPRPSPLAVTAMRFKDAYVKIMYSQPQKRGREIFGKLVPYGQVWRLGANEATEITLTKDILINNQPLKAGTYSMFTIPDKEKWTIIINSDVGLWGAYNYVQTLDVMRFEVPVNQNNVNFEAFTMQFDQKNELAELLIMWDTVKVSIPFKFTN
jgi:hypothetical protein